MAVHLAIPLPGINRTVRIMGRKSVLISRKRKIFLKEIQEEVSKMLESCKSQKGVNSTIRNGLKLVRDIVDTALKKHKEGNQSIVFYQGR